MKYTILLLIAGSFFAYTPAQGQESVSIKFTVMAAREPINDLYFADGGAYQLLNIPKLIKSKIYEYRGSSEMVFYKQQKTPEGQIQYIPAAVARVPERSRKTLFVLTSEVGSTKYKAIALADDFSVFKSGEYRVLNFTPVNIACAFNATTFALNPNETKTINAEKALKSENGHKMMLKFASMENNKAEMFYSVPSGFLPELRVTFIAFERAPQQYRLKRFDENVAALSAIEKERESPSAPSAEEQSAEPL